MNSFVQSESTLNNAKNRVLKNSALSLAVAAALFTQAPTRALAANADEADGASTSGSRRGSNLDDVVVEGQRQRSTVALEGVSATGSRLAIETKDLPASITVVTQDAIQLHGSRTALEVIEHAVGMSGGTSVGSIPSFATRGFTSNDITIMRDGIRQNTASQSSRPLDSFLFDRVEVLKGPASLLYGEGAVGGAINYVSKLPTDMLQGEVNASVGSWNTYRLGLGAGGPTGVNGLSFRVDASRNTSDGYVDRSSSEYAAYAGALRWEFTDDTSLTLSSSFLKDYTKSYYGTPVVYDAVIDQNGTQLVRTAVSATDRLVNARIEPATRSLNYNNNDNFAKAENSFTRLILNMRLSEHWTLRNEAYVASQHLHWRNTESTIWNPQTQRVDRSSFFLIYRSDIEPGDRLDITWDGELWGHANKFLVGALYDHNDQIRNSGQTFPGVPNAGSPTPASVPLVGFDPGFGPPIDEERTADILTDTAAIYVEDVFDLTTALKFIGGLRYDQIDVERRSYVGVPTFNTSYKPTTGRLGLTYAITPDVNVYASYSRAAQPVSQLVSLAANQTDFSLQKGRQFEIGTKASVFDKAAEFTFAIFDIEKNDLLTSEVVNNVRFNSQIGAQVSQGAEFALAISLPNAWRVDTNLAYTWKAEFKDFFENLGTGVISRAGNTPPNVPKFVGNVFVAKEIGAWSATAGVRRVGERQANNNNGIQLDAYTTVDASIGYRWEHITATLRGRNLTDETYADWATAGGLVQRLADPRSFEFGVHYSF